MNKTGATLSFIKDVETHRISRKIQGAEGVQVFFQFQSTGYIILLGTFMY